ncbi:MAG: DUF2309 domain-containing protein [Pirellulales bacterium]
MPVCDSTAEDLERIIAAAAHFLPAQGPIGVFVHHNTLHAFENLPFEDAVIKAARTYGTEPFLSESRFREELARGRILASDIDAVLAEHDASTTTTLVAGGRVRLRDLHRALLLNPVRHESDVAVRWTLTESDAIARLRPDLVAAADDDAARAAANDLWHACIEAVALARPSIQSVPPPVRFRDLLLAVDPAVDTDALVHPLLIRLCAAFLDQGVAAWRMPGRSKGLLAAVTRLYSAGWGPSEPWSHRLPPAFREAAGRPALECITIELDRLGIPPERRQEFIVQSLLALRGWAGMIHHLEERPDRAPVEQLPARLTDFVAVRLICDRVATEWAASRLRGTRRDPAEPPALTALWWELQDHHPSRRGPGSVARAYLLHQAGQLVGLTAADIRSLDDNELLRFEQAITSFDAMTRRRLFHLAYERRYRVTLLDALSAHDRIAAPPAGPRPAVQWVLCIDERCESFRRNVEELGDQHETFGTAGFFAVPMYFRGLDDWHATPLCPIVMRPRHAVLEVPEGSAADRHAMHRSFRRRYGQLTGSLAATSHSVLRGGLFAPLIGGLSAVPLVARVAFPRLSARLGRVATEFTRRRITTRLDLESGGPTSGSDPAAGFDVAEMAEIVRRVLEDIGLTTRLAPLVAVLGHGSSSRNNPHESAYECGACGGGRGGPNARAFAMMANDPRVRERLAADGLAIPPNTWFVGGMLDTCASTITWYDTDLVPPGQTAAVAALRATAERVAAADARERCRRFDSAPLDITAAEARVHVESRSVDLAQVRPELGHATNAACIIGRRWRTRGLYLDRRAFLVSYDPSTDGDASILARTLAAVGPVGAGINLEYYFSVVDRLGYGAGTKLPHNITGLIGVMDGHASDLRTGLPWQMVEIHEPVRLLVVVDATPEAILAAAAHVPAVARLAANRWIQLVSWHPVSGELAIFRDGSFEPYAPERQLLPEVRRSRDWYGGHRGHLEPAVIQSCLTSNVQTGRPAATENLS